LILDGNWTGHPVAQTFAAVEAAGRERTPELTEPSLVRSITILIRLTVCRESSIFRAGISAAPTRLTSSHHFQKESPWMRDLARHIRLNETKTTTITGGYKRDLETSCSPLNRRELSHFSTHAQPLVYAENSQLFSVLPPCPVAVCMIVIEMDGMYMHGCTWRRLTTSLAHNFPVGPSFTLKIRFSRVSSSISKLP
jgi:hypothetical protein